MDDSRKVRPLTVLSVSDVTPAMRRLVLGGAAMVGFATPAGALGPYLKLHLRRPDGRTVVRTYSVRSHDPDRDEIAIDMLLHGDGAGARFAAEARPGDTVGLAGPGHIPAPPCAMFLLAGDHTALPAIAHILAGLPARSAARVVIEVPGPEEEQDLQSAAAVERWWLHRPAGAPSRLVETLRACWPDGRSNALVWAGAEAALARAIRAEARTLRGVPPARCQVLNYWKAGQPEGAFGYCD